MTLKITHMQLVANVYIWYGFRCQTYDCLLHVGVFTVLILLLSMGYLNYVYYWINNDDDVDHSLTPKLGPKIVSYFWDSV